MTNPVFDLMSQVASGRMDMADAKARLRSWYAALPAADKARVFEETAATARRMASAAEGLAQELQVISSRSG